MNRNWVALTAVLTAAQQKNNLPLYSYESKNKNRVGGGGAAASWGGGGGSERSEPLRCFVEDPCYFLL